MVTKQKWVDVAPIERAPVQKDRGWIKRVHALLDVPVTYDWVNGVHELPKPLTHAEFFALNECLFTKTKSGRPRISRRKYEAILVVRNLRLAYHWAARFRNSIRWMEFEEVYAEGVVALTEMARKFEPERGLMFTTCATVSIKNYFIKFINSPHLEVRGEYPRTYSTIRNNPTAIFNQAPTADDRDPLAGIIYQPQVESLESDEKWMLREQLKKLSEREAGMMHMRFFRDFTLQEIANEYSLTKERVRQIEGQCLAKIRAAWPKCEEEFAGTAV